MFSKRSKIQKEDFYDNISKKHEDIDFNNEDAGLDFLVSFFDDIRPSKIKGKENAEANLKQAITFIEENPFLANRIQLAILSQLLNADLKPAFTESGIPDGGDFWQELMDRIKHRLLPKRQNRKDFLFVIDRIFYNKNDYKWVESIKRNVWIEFFELLQFTISATDKVLREHLFDALIVLSYQVANSGLEKEIADYISPFTTENTNPFIVQNQMLHELQTQIAENPEDIRQQVNNLKTALYDIQTETDFIKKNQGLRGTSLRQSYALLILGNRIERMLILLDTLDGDGHFDMGRFVDLFKILVHNQTRKNSVRDFISESSGQIAYQIAEHKGAKGGKYITTTIKEYFGMLGSAMWGGAIICFVCILKNLIEKLHYAYFWQGFWYSVNYSIGFVAIDQTGSTLATKQPAFTANTVASSLDSKKQADKPDLTNLAVTVAKVIRSQTASFVGNLIVVFPGTYLLAWLYELTFHQKIASGKAALALLSSQNPFQSLSWLYACNTGVFLFLSGIIAGYVQNKIKYGNVSKRLTLHPAIYKRVGRKGKIRFAKFIEKAAGSIAGSVSLGFFLGMAGPIGKIFGIPFDIRHITISSGNMAIGVYGLGFNQIPTEYLITVFIGVLGIGFFNFLVSFSLSFTVALRARGIRLSQYPELFSIVASHFFKHPLSFILPSKSAKV